MGKEKTKVDAEQVTKDYVNMSEQDWKKMMRKVVRRACEDQLKLIRKTEYNSTEHNSHE